MKDLHRLKRYRSDACDEFGSHNSGHVQPLFLSKAHLLNLRYDPNFKYESEKVTETVCTKVISISGKEFLIILDHNEF